MKELKYHLERFEGKREKAHKDTSKNINAIKSWIQCQVDQYLESYDSNLHIKNCKKQQIFILDIAL